MSTALEDLPAISKVAESGVLCWDQVAAVTTMATPGRCTPPGWLVRRIRRRDGGCRFPGCGRTRWTDSHHIVHWADGGATDSDNLITLCGFHHRFVHRRG